jgi:hypothetical protein
MPDDDDRTEPGDRDRSHRLAFAAFVAVEVGAFVLWLWLGRKEWFWGDEWDFLAGRTAFDLHDLFAPHGNHWKTLPILVYRAMWQVFGINSHTPYLVLVISSHLTIAALLRAVMRRADVNPWIATAAASLFALYGTGWYNIIWAFQIGLNGAVAFGLVQLLLADHDGQLGRRDLLGIAAGLAAIMCALAGVAMVAATALAVLARRGWRAALVYAGVPAGAYVVWWAAIGRDSYGDYETSISATLDFVRLGVQRTFSTLGQIPGLGAVLGVLLVVGLVLAWRPLDRPTLIRRAAAPAALLMGALFYLLAAGIGRAGLAFGAERATTPYFLHVVAALSLPAIAIALDAFARRWRVLTPVACILLLVGVPGNVDTLADNARAREPFHRGRRNAVLTIPVSEAARDAPREVKVDPNFIGNEYVTLGWLLDGVSSGRVPRVGPLSGYDEAAAALRLSFLQTDAVGEPASSERCVTVREATTHHFSRGDTIQFAGTLRVEARPEDTPPNAAGVVRSAARVYFSYNGPLLTAVRDDFDVVVSPLTDASHATMCAGEG